MPLRFFTQGAGSAIQPDDGVFPNRMGRGFQNQPMFPAIPVLETQQDMQLGDQSTGV